MRFTDAAELSDRITQPGWNKRAYFKLTVTPQGISPWAILYDIYGEMEANMWPLKVNILEPGTMDGHWEPFEGELHPDEGGPVVESHKDKRRRAFMKKRAKRVEEEHDEGSQAKAA